MTQSRTFLWAISLSLVAVAGCGGDDTTITSGSTSASSSGSSSGDGGMGTGGNGNGGSGNGGSGTGGAGNGGTGGTGGMATGGMGGASTGGMGGMGTGGTGGMATGGMGGMGTGGTGGMATGGMGGMGGSGGMGGGGGAGGGSAAMCNPEGPFDGAPVTAQANQWTWVDVPEAKCRNGSATGFGVRINPNSTKVVIYFQGGGACFNGTTCFGNPSSFGAGNLGNPSGGIFDRNNNANPIRDWSFVYVPYCTGDVFTGNATGVDVPGALAPKNQSFVGYANVGHYLKRVIPTFPNVTQVLVTGESAGGFGAFYNYDRIAQAFCPTPVALVDDSGPPMSDTYMAPCLQQRWRTLFNINGTLPKDCTDCNLPNGGGLANAWKHLAQKYPTAHLGVISSNRDSTIRQFYGFGQNNCAQLDGFAGSLPEATYAAGLTEVRDVYLKPSPAWSSFFINSTAHTYLGGNSYYNTTVMGTAMTTWVAGIVDGAAAAHIGP